MSDPNRCSHPGLDAPTISTLPPLPCWAAHGRMLHPYGQFGEWGLKYMALLILKIYFTWCVCLWSVWVCASEYRHTKKPKVSDSLKLELYAIVIWQIWMLETKLRYRCGQEKNKRKIQQCCYLHTHIPNKHGQTLVLYPKYLPRKGIHSQTIPSIISFCQTEHKDTLRLSAKHGRKIQKIKRHHLQRRLRRPNFWCGQDRVVL